MHILLYVIIINNIDYKLFPCYRYDASKLHRRNRENNY